ncbi:hypothetical protein ABZP36_005764 [Zizania latifolia]
MRQRRVEGGGDAGHHHGEGVRPDVGAGRGRRPVRGKLQARMREGATPEAGAGRVEGGGDDGHRVEGARPDVGAGRGVGNAESQRGEGATLDAGAWRDPSGVCKLDGSHGYVVQCLELGVGLKPTAWRDAWGGGVACRLEPAASA